LAFPAFGQRIIVTANTNGVVQMPVNFWAANADLISAGLNLTNSINLGTPNGDGAKVHWSQLTGVPAGFADGADDGIGGGSGTVTSVGLTTTLQGLTVENSPVTTTGSLALGGVLGIMNGGTGGTNAATARAGMGLGSSSTNDVTAFEPAGVSAADITNSTAAGRALLTAVDAAAQLTALGTASLYEPLNAAKYQPTNLYLTEVGARNAGSLTNLNASELASGTVPTNRMHADMATDAEVDAKILAATNFPVVNADLVTTSNLVAQTFSTSNLVVTGGTTLSNATLVGTTLTGSFSLTQTELQPHSTVTNFVMDPTAGAFQLINATNWVVKFLHATNIAAGRQAVFLVLAGTNATVSVEIPSTGLEWTNKVSIAAGSALPVSLYGYGANNTNVVLTLGRALQ